jgi:hypothetical protein
MNCYKFATRAQFRTLAEAEGLICLYEDDNGEEVLITNSHTYSLVEVGTIAKGGACDPETGEVITPPTVLAGWHVNTQGLAPEAWDRYLVVVNHPTHTFFGGPTQAPDTAVLMEMTS